MELVFYLQDDQCVQAAGAEAFEIKRDETEAMLFEAANQPVANFRISETGQSIGWNFHASQLPFVQSHPAFAEAERMQISLGRFHSSGALRRHLHSRRQPAR